MVDWSLVPPVLGVVAIIACVGYSIAKRRFMTFGIMFACIFVFMLELASLPNAYAAGNPWLSRTAELLSYQTSYITTRPAMLYTLITAMFVHSGIGHLIFNLLSLLMIGTVLEDRIGAARMGIIYFTAGIFATFFFSIFTPGSTGLLMGASGAFCGVLGAFTRLYPREKIRLFMFFFLLPPLPMYMIAILFIGLETVFAALGGFNFVGLVTGESGLVAHTAHIGGFIFGLVVAPWIMKLQFDEPGKTKKKVAVDIKALRRVAVTEKQKGMLAKIEKEDEPDVKRAWIEELLEKSRCPDCGRPLKVSGGAVNCKCGFKLKF
jgi:membrane associated rhomboid family serine protease